MTQEVITPFMELNSPFQDNLRSLHNNGTSLADEVVTPVELNIEIPVEEAEMSMHQEGSLKELPVLETRVTVFDKAKSDLSEQEKALVWETATPIRYHVYDVSNSYVRAEIEAHKGQPKRPTWL